MAVNKPKYRNFLLFLLLAVALFSCKSDPEPKRKIDPGKLKEPLIEANKRMTESEFTQIKDFMNRYNWEMQASESGLYYDIYKQGEGKKAKAGNQVTIDYKLYFLTGDLIESTEEGEALSFVLEKDDVIIGMHEAIQMMHKGSKGRFIIPSHLGYGLLGKEGKIPPKTTLVYDIELINVK